MLKAKLSAIFSIISAFLMNKCVIIKPGKNNTKIEPKEILNDSTNVKDVNDKIVDIIIQITSVIIK